MTIEQAAVFRLDHWRERWECVPWCTAAGPVQPHTAHCRSVSPPDHPTVGLIVGWW